MDKAFEEKIKNILLKQREDIINKIQKREKPDYSKNDYSDDGDIISTDLEIVKGVGFLQHDQDMLKAIEAALSRISTGEYGKCKKCGKQISKERLEALPYALLCIDCKTDAENKDSRRKALENSKKSVHESEEKNSEDSEE